MTSLGYWDEGSDGLRNWRFVALGSALNLGVGSYVIGGTIDGDPFRTFVASILVNAPLANFDSGKFADAAALQFPNLEVCGSLVSGLLVLGFGTWDLGFA